MSLYLLFKILILSLENILLILEAFLIYLTSFDYTITIYFWVVEDKSSTIHIKLMNFICVCEYVFVCTTCVLVFERASRVSFSRWLQIIWCGARILGCKIWLSPKLLISLFCWAIFPPWFSILMRYPKVL